MKTYDVATQNIKLLHVVNGYDMTIFEVLTEVKRRHFNKMPITSEVKTDTYAEIRYQLPFDRIIVYGITLTD